MGESLKQRLSALRMRLSGAGNGSAVAGPSDPATSAASPVGHGHGGALSAPAVSSLRAEPVGVETFLPGGELVTGHGSMYLHERRRSELDKDTARFLRRRLVFL